MTEETWNGWWNHMAASLSFSDVTNNQSRDVGEPSKNEDNCTSDANTALKATGDNFGERPKWVLESERHRFGAWGPTNSEVEDDEYLTQGLRYVAGVLHDPPPFLGFYSDVLVFGNKEPTGIEVRTAYHAGKLGKGIALFEEDHPYVATDSTFNGRNDIKFAYGPCIDAATARDGWLYGSSFERMGTAREGGRASVRVGDKVRQRWWCLGLPPLISDSTADAEGSTEAEGRSFERIIALFNRVIGKRSMSQIPVDPFALARRIKEDDEAYISLCERLPLWQDLDLLGQFCVASLYARAVYGFGARKGMFDDIVRGAALFSVQKAMFDLSDSVSDEANVNAFCDMIGIPTEHVLLSNFAVTGPLSVRYVVSLDLDMKWLIVSIQGTFATSDILTDLVAHDVPFLDGTAHEGIAECATKLIASTGRELCAILTDSPELRLVFTGHSMGAGVASLAAALAAKEIWGANCICFGIATPSIVSKNLADEWRDAGRVFTAVNCLDWVPRASHANVDLMFHDLHELSTWRQAVKWWEGSNVDPQAKSLVEHHEEEIHYPPGHILQIHVDKNNLENVRVLQSEVDDYRRMIVWLDFDKHLPLSYSSGLLKGYRGLLEKKFTDANQGRDELMFVARPRVPEGNVANALRRMASEDAKEEGRSCRCDKLKPKHHSEEPDNARQLVATVLELSPEVAVTATPPATPPATLIEP